MRVIAGSLGGRVFSTPNGKVTHPMSERVRGALFNIIGDLNGQSVLDPYSGSGALSFEAISRGAKSALAIEKDPRAHVVIADNIKTLRIDRAVKSIRANCVSWSQNNPEARFDLILVDPPYDAIKTASLEAMASHLQTKGLMVLSYPGREPAPTVNGVVVVDTFKYGTAALAFYRLAR